MPKTPSPAADITVISGPSAVGKGTLVKLIKEKYPQVWVSISATTRPPRPGEINGVHYYFVSDDEFDDLIKNDGLLEWAQVHGTARYGTPSEPVFVASANGRKVILEIDLQGARQIRNHLPEARFIFVNPPSWDALLKRLEHRGTESTAEVERRLATAREEMAAANEFDRLVVNDDLGTAVAELVDLIGLQQ